MAHLRSPHRLIAALLVAAGAAGVIRAQANDPQLEKNLRQLFPAAKRFSGRTGSPPHFEAFAADPRTGADALSGLAFWTTELEPLERGYDGPIKMLVGMDTKGILTGVIVVQHREPYGDRSIERPEFPAQFKGKNIRDPFKVGSDVDAVSGASITIGSATRAIRNSSRRIAKALLTPPSQ
jgi:NosR/NirI family nitrous oxide reductase transcriptional regulator